MDWAAWGGVVRGNSEALLPLAAAGVPGFKCFLIHSGIDGFSWVDEADLRLALDQIRETGLRGTGLPLLVHAEVAGPVNAATESLHAANADWRKYSTYLASRPDAAEVEAIELLIRLAEEFDTPIHIVHLASAQALPLLAEARSRGVPITVETCVQYLWFAAEEIPDGATEFKCAPPIRGRANREALWAALEAGLIDMVTTDHSPCPPAMKRREEGRWDLAWGGIASLGLALPVVWTALARRGVDSAASMERIAKWMAAAPARLAGLAGRKGVLAAGADADFVVFDPDAAWTVTPGASALSPQALALRWRGVARASAGNLAARRADLQCGRTRKLLHRFAARQRVGAAMRDRAQRAIAECKLIAAMSEEPGRITRRFLTPPMHDVHAHLRARMEALGMTVEVDAAGNLRGLWQPSDPSSQTPDSRFAHRHRARRRRIRWRTGRGSRARMGRARAASSNSRSPSK